jgi:hypothetical protein
MGLLGQLNRLFQVKKDRPSIDSLKIIDEIANKRKPRKHWEYAVAQYECQAIAYNNRLRLIAFFPILLFLVIVGNGLLFFVAVANFFKRRPSPRDGAAALLPGPELVPYTISGEVVFLGKSDLNPHFLVEDWWYGLLLTLRYLVYPYFVAKCLYAIYQHSGICKTYSKAILSNEYSFCSSVITHYLNRAGVLSINCMHGEKLFNARDSFCCYDVFIVWDEHYVDMFKKMKAEARFIVSHCPASSIERLPQEFKAVSYFLQGGESAEQIRHILKKITVLSERHKCDSLWIKPHPIYRTENLEELVGAERIYRSDNAWLVSNSKVVCGRYSTILFQVYVSRADMTFPLIYIDDQFWDVPNEYIMLAKADGRLSDIT